VGAERRQKSEARRQKAEVSDSRCTPYPASCGVMLKMGRTLPWWFGPNLRNLRNLWMDAP
jgi:hypothetical protein